jgi:RND family efflux transporter MFP subunit
LAGEWVKIRRRLWSAGQVVIVLGIVGAVVYWAQFAPLPVSVHVVQRGEIVAEVMGTGTLESHISATVSPKISGLITEVAIDQGDRVQRGQVLVRLHDADLGRQVEVAQSSVAAAQAAVSRQEADLARAVAVLDLARYDFDVIQNLLQQGTGSATEFEDARKTLRVSEAELARAEAALAEARKQVIAAEKTLEFQKAKLADTVVSAPFDGLIARRDRDPGDVIVPGSSVLLLVATDEMWISAWVDESEMGRLSSAPTLARWRDSGAKSIARRASSSLTCACASCPPIGPSGNAPRCTLKPGGRQTLCACRRISLSGVTGSRGPSSTGRGGPCGALCNSVCAVASWWRSPRASPPVSA